MKRFLKILALAALAAILAVSMTACSEQKNPDEASPSDTQEFDFSSYPASFAEWKDTDLQTYLTACNLLDTEKDGFIFMPLSANETEAFHATASFMYVDGTAGSVSVIALYFDQNTAEAKASLDDIKANHAVMIDGTPAVPMDAALGNFAISYTNGTDEDYITSLTSALTKLATHYEITPDFLPEA